MLSLCHTLRKTPINKNYHILKNEDENHVQIRFIIFLWIKLITMKRIILAGVFLFAITEFATAQFQYISPRPGSIYQNTNCTIILREGSLLAKSSLQKEHLFGITGAISGTHSFETILSDDGKTIILKPESDFAANEQVTVTIHRGIRKINGEIIEGYTFSFKTHPARSGKDELRFAEYRKKMMEAEFGTAAISEDFGKPEEKLPKFIIGVNTNPAPGDLFFHNLCLYGLQTEKAVIMTSDGDSVYSKRSKVKGLNFTLNHNGYLTMYNEMTDEFDMLDSSYNKISSYHAGNGYITDIHEFQIFPDGHSLLVGLDYETVDMTVYDSSYSSHATVIGAILQELDASKNVIFEWRSWDYIDVTEALHEALFYSFIDYVHANSIELDTDGNILLSCRHLDQVIKINRNTGDIIWRLGGIKNEFTFINDPYGFNYQHDVRRIANGHLTLFDNGNYHPEKISFAKEYALDEVNKKATLVWSYHHPFIGNKPVIGYAMGNVQRLPNGNTLINWGSIYNGVLGEGSPNVTEVDAHDSIVWEMTLDPTYRNVTYRAHRFEWSPCARPTGKLLTSTGISQTAAKLSWTAATGASSYLVSYKPVSANTWSTTSAADESKHLSDLQPATTYQWYVQSLCDQLSNTLSAASEVKKFTTLPLKVFSNPETENNLLQVYPNPSNGSFMLQIPGNAEGKLHISLKNVLGNEVFQEDVDPGSEVNILLPEIPSGCYLIMVADCHQKWMKQVIRE